MSGNTLRGYDVEDVNETDEKRMRWCTYINSFECTWMNIDIYLLLVVP